VERFIDKYFLSVPCAAQAWHCLILITIKANIMEKNYVGNLEN
jgi:hypothetical protein